MDRAALYEHVTLPQQRLTTVQDGVDLALNDDDVVDRREGATALGGKPGLGPG